MKIAFITDEVTQSFDEAVRFALASPKQPCARGGSVWMRSI